MDLGSYFVMGPMSLIGIPFSRAREMICSVVYTVLVSLEGCKRHQSFSDERSPFREYATLLWDPVKVTKDVALSAAILNWGP